MVLSIHHQRYAQLRQHLKDMRKRAKLTQVGIAERLEQDQSYISKIERGERYVDTLFYFDWCYACGVSPEQAVRELLADQSYCEKTNI